MACADPVTAARDATVAVDAAPSDASRDVFIVDAVTAPDVPMLAPSCGGGTPLPAWATFDGATLTARCATTDLRATALDDGALRLRYLASGAAVPATRSWAVVDGTAARAASASGDGDGAVLCGDGITVRVAASTCRVTVTDGAGHVLVDDGADGGWSEAGGGIDVQVRVVRATPPTERFYGLGERSGRLARRGTYDVFWGTDQYDSRYGGVAPGADPLYASIPVYVGVRDGTAYGVFTDVPRRLEVDAAARDPSHLTVAAAGTEIDQYVFAGPRMADVLRRYGRLTGTAPTPPRWALGYHQCRWGYADAARVEEVATQFRNRAIPVDAIWLDIQHMDGFRTFTWDPAHFADPAAMTRSLAAMNVHTVVIADPGLKVDDAWSVYRDGVAGGHFLHDATGALWTGVVWPGRAAFPDFTRGATRAWWGGLVGGLAAVGVDGVWLDVNEPTLFPEGGGGTLPGAIPVDGDGVAATLADAHNVYALEEARATREGLQRAHASQRPFVLTRAGYAGIQRYAAMWTGDAPSTWPSLRQQLPTMLNLGLSGMPFVGSDVGGYSGHATPELFARWVEVGSISPFFRGHVTQGVPDQEPWAFGTEVEDISRTQIDARMRRMPYLEALFAEAQATGAPVLRPLAFHFDDAESADVDDEAMLGPWLLVAPVLDEGATTRRVHLPPGRWFEEQSGAIWDGPADLDLDVTLAALPTFVREGAIVPSGPVQQSAGTWARSGAPLELDVYPVATETSFTVLDDLPDGAVDTARSRATLRTVRTASGMSLTAQVDGDGANLARSLTVRVHRVDVRPTAAMRAGATVAALDDAAWRAGTAPGWWWDANDRTAHVRGLGWSDLPLSVTYDLAVAELRPSVDVTLDVTVPDGTSRAAPVYVATSANGWTQHALAWDAATGHAHGVVTVPRGQWFFYKYTRGGWDTVERYPDCSEASNRYGFGAANPVRADRVWTWRDRCP